MHSLLVTILVLIMVGAAVVIWSALALSSRIDGDD